MSDETPADEGAPEELPEERVPAEPETSDLTGEPIDAELVPDESAEADAVDGIAAELADDEEPAIEAELMPDEVDEPAGGVTGDAIPAFDSAEPDDALEGPYVAASPEVLAALAARPSDEEGRRRPTARDIAALAGRTTAGAVVAAVAVAVVLGATFITPTPITSTAPKPIVAEPSPAAERLVCPGGLLRLADDTGADASRVSPLGAPATAWAPGGAVRTGNVGTTNAGTDGTLALAEIGTVAPEDDGVPAASGLQSQLLLGETRGLATAACATAQSDEWLVAGATTLGRTSFVVVTNPSDVDAIVDLEIYGPSGLVTANGTTGIRLAPGEQRVVPLNGLAVDLDAPVIHVTSEGGRVVASLEQTITHTLTPGGADWSGAQQPGERLVIPGVHVTDANALAPIDLSETDHADVTPVVRLLAPLGADGDTTPATATVAWIPDGSTLAQALAARDTASEGGGDQGPTDADVPAAGTPAAPRSMDVPLTPGVTTELPVSGLGAGDYTVVVIASTAVVGGVRASTIADAAVTDPSLAGGADFAWFEPAAALGDDAIVAVPSPTAQATAVQAQAATLGSALRIANPTDSAATVGVTTGEGARQTVEIAPGETAVIPVSAGTSVRLDGVGGLSAAIVTGGPGLLAQSPVEPPSPSASPVNVHL